MSKLASFKALVEKATSSRLFKDFLWNAIGRFGSAGISFLITLILMAILDVPDYGDFVVYFSLYSTIPFFLDVGLNNSFTAIGSKVLNDGEEKFRRYTGTYLSVKFLGSFIVIVFSTLIYLTGYINLLMVQTIVLGTFLGIWESLLTIYKTQQKFKVLSILLPIRNVVALAGFIVVRIFIESPRFDQYLVAIMLAPLIMSVSVYIFSFRIYTVRFDNVIAKNIARSSIWVALFTLTTALHARADVYMIKYFANSGILDKNELGIYSATFSLIMIANLITSTFAEALLPRFSRESNHSYFLLFFERIKRSFPLTLIGSILISIAIYVFFTFGFNQKFFDSRNLVFLMMGGTFFTFYLHTLTTFLYPLGKTHVMFVTILIMFILNIAGGFLLIPQFGALGAAVMYMIVPLLGLLICALFLSFELKKS